MFNSPITLINKTDADDALKNMEIMASELLLNNGKLKLLPTSFYDKYSKIQLRLFCHIYGRYGIPTLEVVDYLKQSIKGRSAIEIGAGHGDFGYHLGIPATDSKIQLKPEIRSQYEAMGQPIIQYPSDVQELEALEAIDRYKPEVVIASWVTQWVDYTKTPKKIGSEYGVKEAQMLEKINTYILIGNLDLHGDKDIMKLKHNEISFPYIKSRATNPGKDRVFIWDKCLI